MKNFTLKDIGIYPPTKRGMTELFEEQRENEKLEADEEQHRRLQDEVKYPESNI